MGEQIALPPGRGRGGVIDTEDTLLKMKSVPSSGGVDRRGWEEISTAGTRVPGEGETQVETEQEVSLGWLQERNPTPLWKVGGTP